jgi:alanine dehydrogenase
MRIGLPREIKDGEYRVALTPAGVGGLVRTGHDVVVQPGAPSIRYEANRGRPDR